VKGKADDARKPLVEVVLVLRLLGLHHLSRSVARHELGAAALGEIAGELGVPIILELLDLSGIQPWGTPISASGMEPSE
jgi:hypothetical protein